MMALKCMFPLSKLNGNTTGRYFLRSIKLQVGSQLPEIMLFERINNSVESVNISELYRSKKGVLFSVVGAFTPGCSNAHIPEYINHYQAFRKAGYDLIACVSVNDPFVMSAWCRQTKSEGKIKMLADPKGDFTKALGMELDCTKLLGNIRSKRYSIVLENSIVQSINLEPDHTGLACLLCIKNMKSPH
ncbi:peroxiredoxin-5, mitochondrial-like [Octopus vulgaris]|uniref:Peroxiredoxin-5, mitochondrial-like n=2 Tax=Octopus TaxID=6643 RepID=A0AA36BHI0_OCTVU|nr:peroxiredoxin-5, mitochondrial [Octopus sinensis]CAI9734521.1 peroxiredoxin-5, mitochondrial-like [Octopus vulgaris]